MRWPAGQIVDPLKGKLGRTPTVSRILMPLLRYVHLFKIERNITRGGFL